MSDLFDARPESTPTRSEAVAPITAHLEYQPVGELGVWRVERAAELWGRFHVEQSPEAGTMKWIHESLRSYPLWIVVRRLFGIAPVIPPADADLEDLRVWTAPELCERFGYSAEMLDAQVESCVVHWQQWRARQEKQQAEVAALALPKVELAEGELPLGEEALLTMFGFSTKMFAPTWTSGTGDDKQTHQRPREENLAEQKWFCQRIRELGRMLNETRSGVDVLARTILMNELDLRRLHPEMAKHPPFTVEWRRLNESKGELESRITEQHAKLTAKFPEMAASNKVAFRYCIADLITAERDYYAYGDNRLIDKIRTVAEVDFLTRGTVQQNLPKMRLGQDVFILSAIEGLRDPNWRPWLPNKVLRKLDAGVRAAIEVVRQGEGEQLVDIEKEGEEFEDFMQIGKVANPKDAGALVSKEET